ncbi:MAG: zinc-ribbon domain-containing protein [Candidatus Bathyarchaeia archaeon]
MSHLNKKDIVVDGNLSKILGVEEGGLVSYSDILRGIHSYIKLHGLKRSSGSPPRARYCTSCGTKAQEGARFCDACGQELA